MEDRRENAFLEQVRLIWFPGEGEKPYVILCAGGSYQSVCSMVEAFPAAAALNRAGYTAFVLNYRTDTGTGEAVMPKPLEDLAEALKYVDTHREEFGLKHGNYAAAGFSAGANLVNLWGLDRCGYRHYHARKPDVLFCSYTVSSVKALDQEKEKVFLETMFGRGYGREALEQYDVLSNLTEDYPACYINACGDDEAVPVSQSEMLHERLAELGVENRMEIGKSGGHGYGIGRGTDVEGWLERAINFWIDLKPIGESGSPACKYYIGGEHRPAGEYDIAYDGDVPVTSVRGEVKTTQCIPAV